MLSKKLIPHVLGNALRWLFPFVTSETRRNSWEFKGTAAKEWVTSSGAWLFLDCLSRFVCSWFVLRSVCVYYQQQVCSAWLGIKKKLDFPYCPGCNMKYKVKFTLTLCIGYNKILNLSGENLTSDLVKELLIKLFWISNPMHITIYYNAWTKAIRYCLETKKEVKLLPGKQEERKVSSMVRVMYIYLKFQF